MAGVRKMDKAKAMMIYVEEQDHARLKRMARQQRTSMADLVRQMVTEYMEQHGQRQKREVRP